MNVKLPTALRNARLTLLRDAIDAGANPGYMEFYTAPQPSTGGAAITTQTKLGTCVFSDPCGTVSDGVLTFDVVEPDSAADDNGTIVWARFYDSSGAWVFDADCGDQSSNALIKFNTLSVIAGGMIQILSVALTEGNS